MKHFIAATALAATLAQPATAVTFPTLTTIYVGSGVRDNGAMDSNGTATTFHCSNVSGLMANVRFLVLDELGDIRGSVTLPVPHGRTLTVSTHRTLAYAEYASLATSWVAEGVVNIESTQSGIFCTAKTIDASLSSPVGVSIDLVRINPHPGTVE